MSPIIHLLNLLQISRKQPQYGYALMGGNDRIGNLAEHHYLVAMTAWQLVIMVNNKGANVDLEKVLGLCLIHDLGEIFGGDIGSYYAKANPEAKMCAKRFESENEKFLLNLFENTDELQDLSEEFSNKKTDEARISKLADLIELTHYKLFTNQLNKKDISLVTPKMKELVKNINDKVAQGELSGFINVWENKMKHYDSFLDASTNALGI